MPESHASYGVFLGEFYWSRAFTSQEADDDYNGGWTRDHNGRMPIDVIVADDEYGRERGGFDCSLDDSILISLPCRFLSDGMGLDGRGEEGSWFDSSDTLVALDPSVKNRGPHVLLFQRDALLTFLSSQGLTLFWTLLGEKRTIGGLNPRRDEYLGHLELNGAYIVRNGEVVGATRSEFHSPTESSPKRRAGRLRPDASS
ncbi:MAG: hypothetical protein U1E05_04250 [Patescibacteria group bacterium]|nr:hypothetical protein [Patescibacteria group bacterium]